MTCPVLPHVCSNSNHLYAQRDIVEETGFFLNGKVAETVSLLAVQSGTNRGGQRDPVIRPWLRWQIIKLNPIGARSEHELGQLRVHLNEIIFSKTVNAWKKCFK